MKILLTWCLLLMVCLLLPAPRAYSAETQQHGTAPRPAAAGTKASQAATKKTTAPQQDNLSQKLNLTPVQQQQITTINQHCQAAIQKLLPMINAKSDKLEALIRDPKASDEAIAKALAELAHVQIEIKLAQILAQRSIEKVYTPRQQAMLKKLTESKDSKSAADSTCNSDCAGGCSFNTSGCTGSCGTCQ